MQDDELMERAPRTCWDCGGMDENHEIACSEYLRSVRRGAVAFQAPLFTQAMAEDLKAVRADYYALSQHAMGLHQQMMPKMLDTLDAVIAGIEQFIKSQV